MSEHYEVEWQEGDMKYRQAFSTLQKAKDAKEELEKKRAGKAIIKATVCKVLLGSESNHDE